MKIVSSGSLVFGLFCILILCFLLRSILIVGNLIFLNLFLNPSDNEPSKVVTNKAAITMLNNIPAKMIENDLFPKPK